MILLEELKKRTDKMINTVSGNLSAKELGSVLCHEHIIACNTAFKSVFERLLYDRNALVGKAVEMLKDAKKQVWTQLLMQLPLTLAEMFRLCVKFLKKAV